MAAKKIIIIGAGIAGLSSAFYLVQQGWQVEIIEQNDLDNNCSYGNAGMIVPSHFTPLAAPGVVSQGVKWMLDSKSPFYVRPSLSGKLISWGLKFLSHSNQKHVDNSAADLRDLNLASSQLYNELANFEGFNFELSQTGILMMYRTEKMAEEEIELAHTAQNLGLKVEILDKGEVQALEPHVALDVLGAVHYTCDGHLYPQKLLRQLINYLKNKGVQFHTHTKVTAIETNHGKITAIISGDKKFSADKYVMTGGAWLPELAKKAGLKIPVMPGKGYSFMYSPTDANQQLEHAALLLESKVAVTPMNGQIRFGGTMELGAFNDKINMNRVEGIVNSISKYLPDFSVKIPQQKDIWQGYRPCSPDGLPYLGQSQKIENLIVAGGAGMMGLSLGPIFGKVVADLADEQKLMVNIGQYKPERYN